MIWKRISKRKAVIVVAALVMVAALLILLQPAGGVRLRIVRRATEQGHSVAFFRVETARRFQLHMVERVTGESKDNPYQFTDYGVAEFWAPGQEWPLGGDQIARTGFGVQAPTNRTWKLRIEVVLDGGGLVDRLKQVPEVYRVERSKGTPFLKRCSNTLHAWGNTRSEWIESDEITNSMAPGTSQARPVAKEPEGRGTADSKRSGEGL